MGGVIETPETGGIGITGPAGGAVGAEGAVGMGADGIGVPFCGGTFASGSAVNVGETGVELGLAVPLINLIS